MRSKISIMIFLASFFLYNENFNAQVGINTTKPSSTLDIRKSSNNTLAESFLTVRISGQDLAPENSQYNALQNSTVVYVTSAPTAVTSNINTHEFYYYNRTVSKWMGLNMPKYFYMPSKLFDTTVLRAKTKDVYQLYYTQNF